ncbi:universal stress protein [Streptomyces virens]|uniref:Universal stress protein n=1 Tax=Streptomyces virens TaxID=285572 RepID=A0ABP6PCN3_9ACTN|nr:MULTISPECIES: universal stress protein [Streptomyces]MBA8976689.1 nucleotide-binding universal stress UspA family protein [Streptomyces calvus]MYS31239.1 universal stress protein [Streptomyces sp. SID7804]
MARTITVGLDGSPESRAAAEWAAREAALRQMPVRLLHVWQPVPEPMAQAPLLGAETHQHWTERIPREAAEGLRLRHPGVEVTTEQRAGAPAEVLLEAARDAELLVLGSRALSGLTGFLIGSVGQSVVARAEVPVILVRAGEQAADEHVKDPVGIPSAATGFRPVVLGLDTDSPDETVITFAFEEARRREATLTVVQGWNLPPYYVYSLAAGVDPREDIIREQADALTEALRPWREKYPDVEVIEASRLGSPAGHLVDAARDASLVVVGRRIRRSPFGVHIGAVAHAVMHHATAPVAVVAHD